MVTPQVFDCGPLRDGYTATAGDRRLYSVISNLAALSFTLDAMQGEEHVILLGVAGPTAWRYFLDTTPLPSCIAMLKCTA